MKILQVVADGAPGGGTNHVMQLLRSMGEPFQCALVTQKGSYLYEQASRLGIRVFAGDFFRSRFDRKAVESIRQAMEEVKPEIVHCHGGRAAFFRSFIRNRIPSVYTVHGFHYARKKILQKIAGWAGEFWSIRKMSRILFVCDYDRELATGSKLLPDGKEFKVVYNGIKPLEPQPRNENLGVGFVGRFVYQKHPELFLEVMEKLPGQKGVMVGGGDLDDVIRKQLAERGLEDRITLLGSLDHEAALKVLSQLDVLLMTPRWEGLPLLPLEAMFMKVPVVSTAVGGIPEVIAHGKTGLLSENEDATELAGLVKQVVEDREVRDRIVTAAHARAHERFSQDAMLGDVRRCYSELAGAH